MRRRERVDQAPRLVHRLAVGLGHRVEVVVDPDRLVGVALVGVRGQAAHHLPVVAGLDAGEVLPPALGDEESEAHGSARYLRGGGARGVGSNRHRSRVRACAPRRQDGRVLQTWTSAQVRAAEEPLLAAGVPLMERAAFALHVRVAARAARAARSRSAGARVVVLAGPGNNGGDALYAGALLARRGVEVHAVLASRARRTRAALAALLAPGGGRVTALVDDAAALAAGADLVLDGLLGIGADGSGLRGRGGASSSRRSWRSGAPVRRRGRRAVGHRGRRRATGRDRARRRPDGDVRRRSSPASCCRPAARRAGRVELVDLGLDLAGRARRGPARARRRRRAVARARRRRAQVHARRRRRRRGLARLPGRRGAHDERRRAGRRRHGAVPGRRRRRRRRRRTRRSSSATAASRPGCSGRASRRTTRAAAPHRVRVRARAASEARPPWSTPARSSCCRAHVGPHAVLTPHAGELARLLSAARRGRRPGRGRGRAAALGAPGARAHRRDRAAQGAGDGRRRRAGRRVRPGRRPGRGSRPRAPGTCWRACSARCWPAGSTRSTRTRRSRPRSRRRRRWCTAARRTGRTPAGPISARAVADALPGHDRGAAGRGDADRPTSSRRARRAAARSGPRPAPRHRRRARRRQVDGRRAGGRRASGPRAVVVPMDGFHLAQTRARADRARRPQGGAGHVRRRRVRRAADAPARRPGARSTRRVPPRPAQPRRRRHRRAARGPARRRRGELPAARRRTASVPWPGCSTSRGSWRPTTGCGWPGWSPGTRRSASRPRRRAPGRTVPTSATPGWSPRPPSGPTSSCGRLTVRPGDGSTRRRCETGRRELVPRARRRRPRGRSARNVRSLAAHAPTAQVMAVVKADGYGHGLAADRRRRRRRRRDVARRGAGGRGARAAARRDRRPPHPDLAVRAGRAAAGGRRRRRRRVGLRAVGARRAGRRRARGRSPGPRAPQGRHRAGPQRADAGRPGRARCPRSCGCAAEGAVEVVGLWSAPRVRRRAGAPDRQARRPRCSRTRCARVEGAGVALEVRHLANSAATLTTPAMHYDLVRPGHRGLRAVARPAARRPRRLRARAGDDARGRARERQDGARRARRLVRAPVRHRRTTRCSGSCRWATPTGSRGTRRARRSRPAVPCASAAARSASRGGCAWTRWWSTSGRARPSRRATASSCSAPARRRTDRAGLGGRRRHHLLRDRHADRRAGAAGARRQRGGAR